tara:strand:+ start:446 stop:631 length:186 start_codon:yes stop_codon:yes gene_type:complete
MEVFAGITILVVLVGFFAFQMRDALNKKYKTPKHYVAIQPNGAVECADLRQHLDGQSNLYR